MFQRTQSIETATAEISILPAIVPDQSPVEEEILAQDLDIELAELTACMAGGVTKRMSHVKGFLKRYFACTAAFVVADLFWLFAMSHGRMVPDSAPKNLLVLLLLPAIPTVLICSLLWFFKDRSTKQEHHALQRLLEIDDIRAASPLIDAMGWNHKRALRPAIWQALGLLLPRMTEDHSLALDKEKRYLLAVWLQGWDSPLNRKLVGIAEDQSPLGLLHVLTQIGQGSFQTQRSPIPVTVHLQTTLKRWAQGKGAGQDPAVQAAAIACRDAIEQKRALARTGEQLLRASDTIPSSPENLLRPVLGSQPSDPQELLRPENPERLS